MRKRNEKRLWLNRETVLRLEGMQVRAAGAVMDIGQPITRPTVLNTSPLCVATKCISNCAECNDPTLVTNLG